MGRSLGASILDLTNSNLHTRISHSEYHSLNGMRDWLRIHSTYNLGTARKTPKKAKIRQAASLHAQVGNTNNDDIDSSEADTESVDFDVSIRQCIIT